MKKIFIIGFILFSNLLYGQPDDPPDPTEIPLGGVEYLLILGGAAGIRRIISEKKRKRNG